MCFSPKIFIFNFIPELSKFQLLLGNEQKVEMKINYHVSRSVICKFGSFMIVGISKLMTIM